jgi:uncharacterized membrane protein YecN with MAPEG domain
MTPSMTPIPITIFTAGLLGLIYLALTVAVARARISSKVMLGDGADAPGAAGLKIAIRAHGNFAEYVPLALILLGGIEWAGAPRWLCLLLAAMLVIGRLAHPFGLTRPAPNPFRAGGAMLTWVMLGIASLTALVLVG